MKKNVGHELKKKSILETRFLKIKIELREVEEPDNQSPSLSPTPSTPTTVVLVKVVLQEEF